MDDDRPGDATAGAERPERAADAGELVYRLVLSSRVGAFIRQLQVRALSDEAALNRAVSQLGVAAIVDVWRHARWVGRVQRC